MKPSQTQKIIRRNSGGLREYVPERFSSRRRNYVLGTLEYALQGGVIPSKTFEMS